MHRLLQATGIDPQRSDLEISESVLLGINRRVRKLPTDLRQLGFGTFFNEFDTGYSSLSNLRKYLFTNLKIDRSFIKGVHTSAQAARIVRSLTTLGRALKISVTAEEVETIGRTVQKPPVVTKCDSSYLPCPNPRTK